MPLSANENGNTPTPSPTPVPTLRPDIPEPTPTPLPAGTGIPRLISPHNLMLEAGEIYEATIVIRNVGTRPVHNLFTIAVPDAPFTVEFLRNTNRISMLGSNAQRNMTLRISVNENAEPGNYSIDLNHFFSNPEDETSTSTDRINIRIEEEEEGTPNVRLGSFQTSHTGVLSPEQTFTVSATIQNIGDAAARDIRVSLPENMRADDDIFIISDLNLALIHTMDAGALGNLNFTFQTSSEIETGAYTILFNVSYREEDSNERISEVFPFIVNAYAPEEDEDPLPTIEIRELTAPTGRINVGQNGVISFYLHNTGEVEARNIRVEATPENEQAVVPMTANNQTIRSLAPGESHRVSFSFSPREAAVTRSYAIRFRTSFQLERGGDTESFDQYVSFNVYNPEEDEEDEDAARQIPRVMVSEYSLNPLVPRAGQEFEMTITFRNTSSTRSVNNIRVLMEEIMASNVPGQGQGPQHFAGFTPVGGSNTLFIDNLAPLGEITKVLRFTTSGEATSGAHTKRISFDYQDQDFAKHEANQQISISVAQVTRLEITNVDVPPFGTAGMPVRFSIRVINSGRVNLSNLRIRTEGTFDVTHAGGETGEFIGQVNQQRTVDFHGQFIPSEPGMHDGVFIVFGEDPTGMVHEVEYPFVINVEGGFDMDGDFMGGDWEGAWEGGYDMGGGRFPDRGGGGMMVFPGDDMGWGMQEVDEPGLLTRIFTHEVLTAPEWWSVEIEGEFTPAVAAMHGIQPERQTRWIAVAGAVVAVIIIIAIPVVLIKIRKRSKLNFDED